MSPPHTIQPTRAMTSGTKCLRCREMGHRQADCKKSGKRALFNEPGEVKNDVEIGKELIFDDYGAM
ncbi:Zinc finger, CCHC-type, partial [Parasponia andersonii]